MLRHLSYGHRMYDPAGPAEAIRLHAEVAFVPALGRHAPPARHSSRFSFNSSTSHSPGSRTKIAPPGRLRGRGDVDSLPSEVSGGLHACGAASGTSRAAVCAILAEPIAPFRTVMRRIQAHFSIHAANAGRWTQLAPRAVGAEA